MESYIYQQKRDALIPEASALADRKLHDHLSRGGRKVKKINTGVSVFESGAWRASYRIHCFWTEFFHSSMNELARREGLVS